MSGSIFTNLNFVFSEPTDTGIIPPQFRKAHQVSPQQQSINAASNHQPETNGDKKQPHQWSSSPVEEWAKEQVRNIFFALNLSSQLEAIGITIRSVFSR